MKCDGTGGSVTERDVGGYLMPKAIVCPNIYVKAVYHHLDPQLRCCETVVKKVTQLVKIAAQHRFLYFPSLPWNVLAAHAKDYVLRQPEPLRYTHRVTSDREIVGVRLGKRDSLHDIVSDEMFLEVASFKDIDDFLRPPQLVIVRLGDMGYKNVAAAGWVYEAINMRVLENKRTWVMVTPTHAYIPGHLAYCDDLSLLLERTFTAVNVVDGAFKCERAQ
jgi:hypothetical protein